jgi:hypothetical protein
MIAPVLADMYSCDEVAECMTVSRELYTALWAALEGVDETVSAEDCGSAVELAQCNGTTIKDRWECFTDTQKTELNELLSA